MQRLVHELQVHQIELEMQNRELRDARQELEVSRNRYVDLYDFAPVGYGTLDDKGCLLEINLTGAALLGRERSRLIGKPFIPFVAKHHANTFLKHLQQCQHATGSVTTEMDLDLKKGRSIPVQLVSVAVQDAERHATVYRTTITDLTERKRAEDALRKMHDALEVRVQERTAELNKTNIALQDEAKVRRQAEKRFRELLESAPDAIVTVDGKGRILLANHQTEKMFGYTKEELLLKPVETLLPDRFRDAHVGHRARYHVAPRTRLMGVGLNLSGRRKDGSEFPIEISLSPTETENGVLITGIIRDITDRKRAEEELRSHELLLEQKVREMDDFIYVVSHDLKEPLRSIDAFSGFLLDDYAPLLDEQGRRHLTFLKTSAVRMKDLIDDLLTLASVSHKGHSPRLVDLNTLVAQAQQDLAFTIQEKRTKIRFSSPLPTLFCDPIRIGEVFKNLLSNATKFNTSTPPRIDIGVRDEGAGYLFSVKDNGIGIDPRYTERVFGLFERLHPQGEFEGTGAGLAICKKMIEGSGGKIWVESQPGEGSTFFFTLPKAETDPQS
jgi:PAS domain S-box-containing protein